MQDVVPHTAKSIRRSQGFDDNITEEQARHILAQAVTAAESTLVTPANTPTETFDVTETQDSANEVRDPALPVPGPGFIDVESNTATTSAVEDTQTPTGPNSIPPPPVNETIADEVLREINARARQEDAYS